jgi:hypothetical protein
MRSVLRERPQSNCLLYGILPLWHAVAERQKDLSAIRTAPGFIQSEFECLKACS